MQGWDPKTNKLTDGTGSMVLPTAGWFSRNKDLPDVAAVIADLRALVAGTAVQWVDGDARDGVRADTSEVRVAGKTLTRFRNPDRGGAIELWCESGHTMVPHVTPVVGYMCDSEFTSNPLNLQPLLVTHGSILMGDRL